MSQEQSAVAEQQEYQYPITIEDSGPATKKVIVEIPRERIEQKLAEQFTELRRQAAIPGFRPGHVPQKLIEKKFSSDVKEQVRRVLISESYEQAVERNSLQVIGEPTFEDPQQLELKDGEGLKYSFEVEVQPEFELPELKGVKVNKPRVEITEENVDQAMQNLREQQGMLVPVEDRGVEPKDHIVADIHIKLGDEVVGHQHDAQIVVRPGRIGGIEVADLDKQLQGLKPGETRQIRVSVPETHPAEKIRGKEVTIEFALKDIKRLELAEINQEFLADLGFENEKQLRDALREQMEQRISIDIKAALREQVHKYLLDNTRIEIPSRLSDRQTQRVVNRRAVELLLRGMPEETIRANVEKLQVGAREEAARELKLFFILQKIANQFGVDVDEAELNGQIAMIAAQRGERPEKLKQQMAKDGTLANMYVQMREHKAVDKILESAEITEIDVTSQKKQ
ncbi:MAG: trigger factor [Phycisphaerae bacterium]|nr:trigger factor [Phycisphaerae bacterium]MDW8263199.1 trigger factor [Phycisphaerales bacterium]